MKRLFRTASLLAALFSISVAVTACGGNSGDGQGGLGGPGTPGYVGNVIPTPQGGIQIQFSATGAYVSNHFVMAGGGAAASGQVCRYFGPYQTTYSCWIFQNNSYYINTPYGSQLATAGSVVSVPGAQLGYGAGMKLYTGTSTVEPGAQITLVSTPTTDGYHANISGTITLPPTYVQQRPTAFPSGAVAVTGLALDLKVLSQQSSGDYSVTGGVIIYVNGTNGTNSAFLTFL